MKKIVWALFDTDQQSVKKALDPKKYEVYSIGLGKGNDIIELDLADRRSADIFDVLEMLPKPDIICASPPCEAFSFARPIKSNKTGNHCFTSDLEERTKEEIEYHNSISHPFNKIKYDKMTQTRENGIACLQTTVDIIKLYNPKNYYIENPHKSLMFKFIERFKLLDGHTTKTTYSSYGFPTEKRTIIYCNKKLDLLNISKKEEVIFDRLTYKERSTIPPLLIQTIFNQF